jgi:folate-dependent phosphoribosylglycinamide formyltransferase PurN
MTAFGADGDPDDIVVNVIIDLPSGGVPIASHASAADGCEYRLVRATPVDDRLLAWIDWEFAPTWWSADARGNDAWCAFDAAGRIAGFAVYGARAGRLPWQRGYARDGVGIVGPYGVSREHRNAGLGCALLDAALRSLHAMGYARAVVPVAGACQSESLLRRKPAACVRERFRWKQTRRYRATILASGGGAGAQSVFDHVASGELPLEIGCVVANRAAAGVIERADRARVPTRTVIWRPGAQTRDEYDAHLSAVVAMSEPEIVLLLGWMHVLAPAFLARFRETINTHPAFLPFETQAEHVVMPDGTRIPAFRGAHAIDDALAAGVAWGGATVHRAAAEVDRGAVVVRSPLRIDGCTTVDETLKRLRPLEDAAIAKAIARWCVERSE